MQAHAARERSSAGTDRRWLGFVAMEAQTLNVQLDRDDILDSALFDARPGLIAAGSAQKVGAGAFTRVENQRRHVGLKQLAPIFDRELFDAGLV
jgi:hypothetical protein